MTGRRPRLRVRLRTVLIGVSLVVLVLPVAGIEVLRLYESALVRQTESELIAQAVIIAASYRARYREALAADGLPPAEAALADAAGMTPRFAELDLADSTVHAPFAGGRPGGAPDALAARLGAAIEPVLREARARVLAEIRLVDGGGVVVATTGGDAGASLAGVAEVDAALAGLGDSRLRRRDRASAGALSRGAALHVSVSSPIVDADRVIGAVLLWRTPSSILQALHHKRYLLLQAGVLMLAVVIGIAIVTSRTMVRPIERLVAGTGRIARGESTRLDAGRYRTVELAQLADGVQAMADSLQRRTNYVRDLSRNVSHEFKTPIAAMSGTLEVLSDHLDDMSPAERARFLANLTGDVRRLERLTRRLLELAQADMPRLEADPARSATVADVLAGEPDLDAGIAIEATGSVTAAVPLDTPSLRAVLRNLAENAAQHGAGKLGIHAAERDGGVCIDVVDDGQGVSPANADRIFEPFFTTRRDHGGTGLGLSIARSLVAGAGGSMSYVAGGAGAAFRLEFPRT